jgi:hypothetical protein
LLAKDKDGKRRYIFMKIAVQQKQKPEQELEIARINVRLY